MALIPKIEVQCGLCGTFVKVDFNKNYSCWRGMCPNKECQLWVVMRVNIPHEVLDSSTVIPKTCKKCGKIWVRKHSCIMSIPHKLSNELQLLQHQDRSRKTKEADGQ